MKRYPLWAVLFSSLMPQTIFALESGVNHMAAMDNSQPKTLQAWAFEELKSLFEGGRETLEPLLPRVQQEFSVLDAEIATFIAEGQQAHDRLQALIDNIGQREITTDDLPAEPSFTPAAEAPQVIVINGVTYAPVSAEKAPLEIGVTEEGRVLLDTSGGIDLPDLTIDPRDGGEYTSEIEVVQSLLDVVQAAQDQVPAPIQTAATDIYNSTIGNLTSDN